MQIRLFAAAATAAAVVPATALGGGRCAIFGSITDTVEVFANTEFGDEYTVEWSGFVLRPTITLQPTATPLDVRARIWSEQDGLIEDKTVGIRMDRAATSYTNGLCNYGDTDASWLHSSGPLPVLQRVHVALVRHAGVETVYVDGVAQGSRPYECDPLDGAGSRMAIGAFLYAGAADDFWRAAAPVGVDWLRVSASARYTGPFSPPAVDPASTSPDTLLLFDFEGADPWSDRVGAGFASPGTGFGAATVPALSTDCDGNGMPDELEVASGTGDVDSDGSLDACESPRPRNHVLRLSAVGDYMEVPHSESLAATAAITVEYWVLFENTSDFGRIAKRPPSGCQWDLSPHAGENATAWDICGPATDVNGPNGFTVPRGRWTHVAGTWSEATGTSRVYVDGVLVRTVEGSTAPMENVAEPILVGMQPCCANSQLFGSVDNLRVWSVERTASQIAAYRFAHIGPLQAQFQEGLVGSWTFEDGGAEARGLNPGAFFGGAATVVDETFLPVPCPADLSGDRTVDGADLGSLLSAWGPCAGPCDADLDRDGTVGGADLGLMLAAWGPCGA